MSLPNPFQPNLRKPVTFSYKTRDDLERELLFALLTDMPQFRALEPLYEQKFVNGRDADGFDRLGFAEDGSGPSWLTDMADERLWQQRHPLFPVEPQQAAGDYSIPAMFPKPSSPACRVMNNSDYGTETVNTADIPFTSPSPIRKLWGSLTRFISST